MTIHELPDAWEWMKQKDVFSFQGGAQPPKSTFTDHPNAGYVRLIQIRDYESDANIVYVPDSRNLRKCDVDDVMIARYGASLGRICRGLQGAYNVALAKAIPFGYLDKRFLYYLLKTSYFQQPLLGQGARSAQAGFNKDGIGNILLPIPPMPDQRAIAEVLGALDDKVAANDRIVTLMDEWVRSRYLATQGGACPLGLIADNVRDQVQPEQISSGTTYLGLEHLPRRRMWNSDIGDVTTVTSAKSRFQQGDVLFGKLRPYFHKVVYAGQAGVCSTDILVIRPKRSDLGGLVLAACSSDDTVRASTASAEGTRMPRTSWKDLSPILVRWPGEAAAVAFSAEVARMSARAHAAVLESRALARTRDELLPLLMSGKIRVRDAERTVEEVV